MKRSQTWGFMALLLLSLIISSHEVKMVSGEEFTPSQCKEEKRLLTNSCKRVVFGQPASPDCCVRVRVSNFECICPFITPKVASMIDVHKVIEVFQVCGRSVPHHFKCGCLNFP